MWFLFISNLIYINPYRNQKKVRPKGHDFTFLLC